MMKGRDMTWHDFATQSVTDVNVGIATMVVGACHDDDDDDSFQGPDMFSTMNHTPNDSSVQPICNSLVVGSVSQNTNTFLCG